MEYVIENQLYLYPTPAGAFYAVSSPSDNQARKVLNAILRLENSPKLTLERIRHWASIDAAEVQDVDSTADNVDEAAILLKRMQDAGWLQGCQNYHSAPEENLEDCLPDLLFPLSNEGKVVLADHNGLIISHVGFADEMVEQIAALSADVAKLYEDHNDFINNNLGVNSNAWANVDAAGNSQLGFWPIYIGNHKLVLVIGGLPRFNQQFLTRLIWALSIRYGASD